MNTSTVHSVQYYLQDLEEQKRTKYKINGTFSAVSYVLQSLRNSEMICAVFAFYFGLLSWPSAVLRRYSL